MRKMRTQQLSEKRLREKCVTTMFMWLGSEIWRVFAAFFVVFFEMRAFGKSGLTASDRFIDSLLHSASR
jgi:heme/copper-type cytochrome/quinol oxidase subunit 3